MNANAPRYGSYETDPTPYLAFMAIAGGLFLSAPAVVGGLALARVARRATGIFVTLALGGLLWTWRSWDEIAREMHRAQRAGQRHGMLTHASESWHSAWPHIRAWWVLAAPLGFALALGIAAFRRRTIEELRERDERRTDRQRRRQERSARRGVGLRQPSPRRAPGFELGRPVRGDQVLPVVRGRVRMPLTRLGRTLLVIGAPGSGKTVTLGRLAYGVASTSDWQVIVLDAKGDPGTQHEFAAAMRKAGRGVQLFPQEPYDGWRGTGPEITNRLIQLIDWAQEGGGAYYRDLAVNLVRLACTAPGGPPRSSDELLGRLDKTVLLGLWAGHRQAEEIVRFGVEHIDACRQRYRSFFDATDGQLDGRWALEDADCAYLLLNELLYADEMSKVARLFIEDFKQYLVSRKPHSRRVLLIVDEFSAIADGERVARMIEIVRSWGAAVVLAPQAYQGMGGDEASARILNAAHTIILHAVPDPDPIIKAAGTRMATEWSLQHEHGRSTDLGSTRTQHQLRIDPNEVRALTEGMAFVIGNGRAQKVQIAPPPRGVDGPRRAEAPPEPEPTDHHNPEPEGPVQL